MELKKRITGEDKLVINLSLEASQMVLVVKNPSALLGNVRDVDSIPGLGRSPGRGNGNPLQYSCLKNLMDRGAWQATVLGITET